MYEEYFRLTASPFSIAPDPRFLYMSARHREAIAHLLFGVRGEGGFVLLTGEIGTGKTTLCRCLLDQIHDLCDVAYILNPKVGVGDLLATICDEFHIELPPRANGIKHLVDAINSHLLKANAAGRRAVLIIDEAQNLQPKVLELLRLLTNLETNTRKLLQIILIGQPELQEMLAQPEMRQVAQRIVARFHLTHLTRAEVGAYVRHRLRVSGTLMTLFPEELIGHLFRLTGGVPRLINLICDRALLGTFVQGKQQVTRSTLKKAAKEVFGVHSRPPFWARLGWRLSFLGAAGGVFVGGYMALPLGASTGPHREPKPAAAEIAPAPPTAQAKIAAPPGPAVAEPPAPVAPPSPEAKPPGNLSWPDAAAPRGLSEKLAFRDLFKLYGLAFDPAANTLPCKAATQDNMHCLYGRGGIADLLRFNQPAVLLMDGDGKEPRYHTVLTALDGPVGTFSVAGETRRVPIADIANAWSGSYVLIWKAPAGTQDVLALGNRGAAVTWLRRSLAAVAGGSTDGPAVFDEDLFRRVKAFQLAEGLVPDGVAGAMTLIRLNMRLDRKLPRLTLNTLPSQDVLHP